MKKLLIASTNKGKIKEIEEKFFDLPFTIISLEKYSDLEAVEEDGKSFTANAFKKARVRAEETGLLTMADDSGLEVEYLKGKPGIYSSRFAGPDANDEDNNIKLLEELKGVPSDLRKARFRCVIAIVEPVSCSKFSVEGICKGRIMTEVRGNNGFGYDPLFFIPQLNKTMAELTLKEKNKISHRAHALIKAKDILKKFLQ